MAVDNDRLMEFLGRFVGDLGATIAAGNVVVGHRLGLYQALAQGPTTPEGLAERADCAPRYVGEWLRGQAAGGYVEFDLATGTYSLNDEQAFCLADPNGPVYLPAAFVLALGTLRAEPRITEAFRTGEGVGWHEQDEDVFVGCEGFFRPGYVANLVSSWIPALDGVTAKLREGRADRRRGLRAGRVRGAARPGLPAADDGRARTTTRPRSSWPASGPPTPGVADRVTFEVASAQTFSGTGFDLVATFDCLHDMGDPLGAARHARAPGAADGTWLVVEPARGDTVEDNLNPVGRVYYGFSPFLCVPNGPVPAGRLRLGAQAGEAAIRQIVTDAGFTRFRRVAETPFNLVYEVRPNGPRESVMPGGRDARTDTVGRASSSGTG